MKRLNSLLLQLSTRNGLLLFLVSLIAVWIAGYLAIDSYYDDEWTRSIRQLYFSRFSLLLVFFALFFASIPHVKSFVDDTTKTATDLSIFRILFFGFFAVGILIQPNGITNQVLPFLEMPESAQVALPWMSWYPKMIPINAAIVQVMLILFYLSIFTSLFGFKTRWSILVFTISLFYLFMIPNLYGKVNHNHHLIWFPAILAFSPCADRFSVDAWFRKRRGRVIHHTNRAYSLPFLFIWILIGLIYFFPGFWKIWSNGLDWALTDNVRNHLYFKWFQLGDWSSWTPIFRIDHYPLLYKASGLFTLIFELFFIPLLLNKSTRKLAIGMGIIFHIGTYIFMHIFFIVLLWSYLSFIDWNKLRFLNDPVTNSPIAPIGGGTIGVKWVGIALIASCIVFGFGKWNSWPFTVYPTFDSMVEVETQELIFSGTSSVGNPQELPKSVLYRAYTSPRYHEMEYDIIASNDRNQLDTNTLDHFLSLYAKEYPALTSIQVFVHQNSIIPEKRMRWPRLILYEKTIR